MIETAVLDSEAHEASFRDPSGFIFRSQGRLLREVSLSYRDHYDLLMGSGLYESLVSTGSLVAHQDVAVELSPTGQAYKVIEPAPIPFISYPYEWCFSQLKDAALLTLEIQKRAMQKGMALKDASAYNIQFDQGRPVLIDTLSFERYDPSMPWVAYRQFCQHFLAPLALMSHVDVSMGRLLALHIDGIPLQIAASALPWKTKWSPTLGIHIHAHAKSQAKHAKSTDQGEKSKAGFSESKMKTLLSGLEIAVNQLTWSGGGTEWADYYDNTHNYGDDGLDAKARLVQDYLQRTEPQTVWDLGANVGKFSQLAADLGAHTVAWDIDPSCVEWNYQRCKEEKQKHLLPLFQDLTNPSSGLGWGHTERASLMARGPVDVVMALGLIHHLVISNNVPMGHVARFLSGVCQHLILEFVPKEDSQVKLLLATREDIFPGYHLEGLRKAFEGCFELVEEQKIEGTCRTLLLFKSK